MKTLLILATLSSLPSLTHAAAVTWGAAFEITSEANINTSYGPVVYAVNGGDNTGNEAFVTGQPSVLSLTIGGNTVSFDGVEAIYGSASTFQSGSFGDLATQPANVTFSTTGHRTTAIPQVSFDLNFVAGNTLGARRYSVGTGNSTLDSILASQIFVDGRDLGTSALNIQLKNLNPGQSYQIQLLGPAANSGRISTATVNDGQGNSVANFGGFLDLDGDLALHVTSVIGTFTADATTQNLNVVLSGDRNTGISGLILSTNIPEPTTLSLGALLMLGCLARRNRSSL